MPGELESDNSREGRVIIDRRPLFVVLLSTFRPQIMLSLILGTFVFGISLDSPAGLTVEAWRVFCVFGLCVVLWVTALIPLAITGLSAIALIPLLGIREPEVTYQYFGSSAVFFILGAFTLGAAVVGCGLSSRLTLKAFERYGNTTWKLVMAVFGFTALLSCVMSEHAVAAMSFPIVWEIARNMRGQKGAAEVQKVLFFAMAWGCIIGGTTTVLGGGRAPLAIGILEQSVGQTITFTQYILLTIPLVILLMLLGMVLLRGTYPNDAPSVETARRQLNERLKQLGKTSLREKLVATVLVVTIGFWVLRGEELGLANIAILSTGALFGLRLVSWKDIEENVNWGVILMYGGAITLGSAMADTGAAYWITEQVFGGWTGSPQLLMLAMGTLTMVMTEFMSNSAVIAILMPPALSLASVHGVPLWMMTMCVVLPSNFAFMFPMATPATALAYSSGAFTTREAIRRGGLLDCMGILFLAFLVYLYWPWVGQLGLMGGH